MFEFTVNGKTVTAKDENKKLLPFLREDLGLTASKEGCGEGACGTCVVLIDGKKTRACIPKLGKLAGKSVITVEGLTDREKAVYTHCFAEAGAVQCGFCIPGMVISAKALLDENPSPNRAEVKEAIKGNICRCTGYVKIEEAILEAGRFFRENLPIPEPEAEAAFSGRFKRLDAEEKVLGTGQFSDDMVLPGMIYAKALRSKFPRAVVDKIDTSAAEKHPDCVRILTAEDVPFNKTGHLVKDWDVLIAEGDTTRYVGDAIVLVGATKKESLDAILDLVRVDYTELAPVTNPFDALRGDAPLIHPSGNVLRRESLKRGNADAAIKAAKYVVTRKYKTPFTEHAYMEPECAVAVREGDGILLYSGSQSVYDDQHEVAGMLRIPHDKVRVKAMLMGGGFGGKEDQSVQHHAALMAWHTGKPVKVKLSRAESLMISTKRHPMDMEFTSACDEHGRLTALKAVVVSDTGAYASLGGPVLQRACTHAAGPYNYQNLDIMGMAVYTNNMPGGAFRGFGVTQTIFAVENNITLLAEMVGMSPWEFRHKNALRPGDVMPNGQIAGPDCAIVQCLEAVKEAYESSPRAGLGCGLKNSGVGVGLPDTGRCILSVEDGKVHIRTSAACMGQGIATMCAHMICKTTGLAPQDLVYERPDTLRTPNSGTSTASRQTVISGEAVRRAAEKLATELLSGKSLGTLEGQEFHGEFLAETDPMGSPKDNPVSHVSYSYSAQVVILDEQGRVEKIVAANDVGVVVNRQSLEGQVEGGVLMGMGSALTEAYVQEDCRPKSKYGTLGLLRAVDAPPIEVILVQGPGNIPYSYGAKGVGELCIIPTLPACSHAYYRLDGKFRTEVPLRGTYYKKEK